MAICRVRPEFSRFSERGYFYPGAFTLALATGVDHARRVPRTPSAAAAHIGTKVVAERKRRGLTQDQLAVLAGIDSSNIRSYETGRAMMSVPTLVRISTALKIDPGTLLAGVTTSMFTPTPAEQRRAG